MGRDDRIGGELVGSRLVVGLDNGKSFLVSYDFDVQQRPILRGGTQV